MLSWLKKLFGGGSQPAAPEAAQNPAVPSVSPEDTLELAQIPNIARAAAQGKVAWDVLGSPTAFCDHCGSTMTRSADDGFLVEPQIEAEDTSAAFEVSPDFICKACMEQNDFQAWKGPVPGAGAAAQ